MFLMSEVPLYTHVIERPSMKALGWRPGEEEAILGRDFRVAEGHQLRPWGLGVRAWGAG